MSSIAPSRTTLPQFSPAEGRQSLPDGEKNVRKPALSPQISPTLKASAEGMEAMFLDHLMTVMRKTVPKSDLSLNSNAVDIYQGMLDSEVSQQAAKSGGVGLAAQIIEYLRQTGYPIYENLRDHEGHKRLPEQEEKP